MFITILKTVLPADESANNATKIQSLAMITDYQKYCKQTVLLYNIYF